MVLGAIAHASHIPARPRIRPEIPEAVEHDIVGFTAANQGITVIAVAEEAMGLIRQFHDGSVRIRVSDQIGAAGRNGGTVAEGVPVIMSTFNISSIAGVGEGVIRQGNRSLRGVENLQIFVVTAAFGVFGEEKRRHSSLIDHHIVISANEHQFIALLRRVEGRHSGVSRDTNGQYSPRRLAFTPSLEFIL